MSKITVKVVGLSFRPTQVVLKPNYKVKLIKEPDNKYDPQAVKVQDYFGNMLGYIGKNDPFRPTVLEAKEPVELKVVRANYHQEGDKKLWSTVNVGDLVQLWLEAEGPKVDKTTFKEIVSYTGESVMWSEFLHSCLDMEDNILLGGSSYATLINGSADFSTIAKNYAKDRGLKTEDVIAFWDSKRDLAGDYGTAVHSALEHYGRFEPILGHELALPTQPHALEVVKAFLEVSTFDNCVVEPLITDVQMGMSGWIDLLRFVGDPRDRVVRIEDFKTIDAEGAKLTKKLKEYAFQLRFYGTILLNWGYKIDKLVIWHWRDGRWQPYFQDFEPIKEYLRKEIS